MYRHQDPQPCSVCGASSLRLYTIPEGAELFRTSRDWFYDRIHQGLIRPTQLGTTRAKMRISTPEMARIITSLTY